MATDISYIVMDGKRYTLEEYLALHGESETSTETDGVSYVVVNGRRYTVEEYNALQQSNEEPIVDVADDTSSTESGSNDGEFPDVSYIVLNGDKYSIDDEQATTDLQRLSQSIAYPYSEESTYDVNQYCIYNGYLYICTEPIYQGEPFDQTHWESVILTDKIGSGGGGVDVNWGSGLIYDQPTNTVSVDVVDDAIEFESRPISSNGVWKEIGNVAILLGTI